MWKREKAAALSGYISALSPSRPQGLPKLEMGDSGAVLIWGGKPEEPLFQFLYNAGLRIEWGKDGLEISTPVRDSSGTKIADISSNRWTVAPPPTCWDKNYTKDVLEIQDRRGHVVLQVRILSDRIKIRGEWRD